MEFKMEPRITEIALSCSDYVVYRMLHDLSKPLPGSQSFRALSKMLW